MLIWIPHLFIIPNTFYSPVPTLTISIKAFPISKFEQLSKRKKWKKIHILVLYYIRDTLSFFVFACLYSFLTIYYKYIIFRFSIPPPPPPLPPPLSPLTRCRENFQPTLLLKPPAPSYLALKSTEIFVTLLRTFSIENWYKWVISEIPVVDYLCFIVIKRRTSSGNITYC